MELWLVYDKENIARNQFFIARWEDAAKILGVRVRLVCHEDLSYGICDNKVFISHMGGFPLPDIAVMRLNAPLLTMQFQLLHISVFNNYQVAHICNDKRLTHQLIQPIAPMMDTVFLRGDEEDPPFPYPVILKAAHGCGGRQVFLLKNRDDFQQALLNIAPDNALVQPVCDTPGQDVRAYVLGREVVKVMLRRSDHDFRSNINQGGYAVPYELQKREQETVREIIAMFDFGLVGIDFIFNRGRLLFNEIEDAVGTRMLYSLGEFDIVKQYLDFILQKVKA